MSLRQVKKLVSQESRVNAEESSSDESVEAVKPNRFAGFSEESEEEQQELVEETAEKKTVNKKSQKKGKKGKATIKFSQKQSEIRDINVEGLVEVVSTQQQEEKKLTEPCLKRSGKHFDSSIELSKLFHEKLKPKSSSHQKSFILTPNLKTSGLKINYLPIMEYKNGTFSFDMSKGYLKLYQDYLFCIESNDPGRLHDFSNKYPFHVESLFQLCLIYKLQAKYEQVYQILERILYCYQASFHHQFSPIGRNLSIDITSTSLNKVFFRSLFMFIDCLGRKGCHRTALEFVKLLLCLDPKDPLGALFLIDFYAISNKKYDFFVKFCSGFMFEYFQQQKTITLPTALYSLALSKALQTNCFSISEKDVDRAFTLNNFNDLAKESANVVLLCAVATFPTIGIAILNKISPSFECFLESEEGYNYSFLAELYVTRNLDLWRGENYACWLKQAFEEAEIVGRKPTEDIWEYHHLDINDFSFSAKSFIPQDLGFK